MNTIIEAINGASEAERTDFLKPFGVKDFNGLVKKFSDLETFKTNRLEEETKKAQDVLQEEEEETCLQKLTKAGIKFEEGRKDPLFKAYMALSESDRPAFVTKMLPKPKSSGGTEATKRQASAQVVEEGESKLPARASKVLESIFPKLS